MPTFNDAFDAEALSVNDALGIFAGSGLPVDTVQEIPPIGSRYFRTTGQTYIYTEAGWVDITGWVDVFEHHYVNNPALGSTNTLGLWVPHTTLTTPDLTASTYRIGWSFLYGYAATNSDFLARVVVNSQPVWSTQIRPSVTMASALVPASAFTHIPLSGVSQIAIEFATGRSNTTAYVSDASIEAWRVA